MNLKKKKKKEDRQRRTIHKREQRTENGEESGEHGTNIGHRDSVQRGMLY